MKEQGNLILEGFRNGSFRGGGRRIFERFPIYLYLSVSRERLRGKKKRCVIEGVAGVLCLTAFVLGARGGLVRMFSG